MSERADLWHQAIEESRLAQEHSAKASAIMAELALASTSAPREQRWLTVNEALNRVMCSESFMRAAIRSGALPVERLGSKVRIDPVQLEAWVRSGK